MSLLSLHSPVAQGHVCTWCTEGRAQFCRVRAVHAPQPSASDAPSRPSAEYNARRKERQYSNLAPLLYAPLLPLLRLSLKNQPARVRDGAFACAVLTALAHAGSVMFGDSTV